MKEIMETTGHQRLRVTYMIYGSVVLHFTYWLCLWAPVLEDVEILFSYFSSHHVLPCT